VSVDFERLYTRLYKKWAVSCGLFRQHQARKWPGSLVFAGFGGFVRGCSVYRMERVKGIELCRRGGIIRDYFSHSVHHAIQGAQR